MINGLITDWPDVVRAAGLPVTVHAGFAERGHGPHSDANVVLHHDASQPGSSPNVAQYLIRNASNPSGSAGLWVDYHGRWHFIAAGVMWHTGTVLATAAAWHYRRAAGVETDHTTGEGWPTVQLLSIRTGLAAILRHEGKSADALNFHKHIASPPGRKPDPDGLVLATERREIALIMAGSTPAATYQEAPEMLIVTADGHFPALLSGGIFVALNADEIASMQAAGIKTVRVRPEVYVSMAQVVNR